MISLSENTLILDPRKGLTRTQQEALRVIAFYRRQRKSGNRWLVGDKKISGKLVSDLKQMALVREQLIRGNTILTLTQAGSMVADRLRVER